METRTLRAGPLTLDWADGDLRRIRVGDRILCLRLYAAVRDRNWGTTPGVREDEHVDVGPTSFRIRFRSHHHDPATGTDLVAHVAYEGGADGTVVCTFDGVAQADFWRNRIGWCVLHPATCAGWTGTVTRADGARDVAPLPESLDPQQPVGPFHDMAELAFDAPGGGRVSFAFDGDVFEMEDQRNWSDASFKTFSTPLRLPYPVLVPAGTRVVQRVTLSVEGFAPASGSPTTTRLRPGRAVELPAVGFAAPTRPLADDEAAWLAAMRPAHLRHGDRETTPDGARTLRRLFFHPTETFAGQPWPERPATEPGIARVSGTDSDGIFLNRMPAPAPDDLDAVAFQINPTVHAADDASVMETLTVQAAMVRSFRAKFGKPVVVPALTLAARFNPYATVPDPPPIPPDPRQDTDFAAAWTLGALAALADGGAMSVTCFTVCGPAGLMDAGRLFPVGRLFLALAAASGPARLLDVDDPFAAAGLQIGDTVFVANLGGRTRTVVWEGDAGVARTLDGSALPGPGPDGALDLPPYGVVVLRPG